MQTTIDNIETDTNTAVVIAVLNNPSNTQHQVRINNYVNKDYFLYFSLADVDKQVKQYKQY
jgi:hypothetical protein